MTRIRTLLNEMRQLASDAEQDYDPDAPGLAKVERKRCEIYRVALEEIVSIANENGTFTMKDAARSFQIADRALYAELVVASEL